MKINDIFTVSNLCYNNY